jgi:hypothetical protein
MTTRFATLLILFAFSRFVVAQSAEKTFSKSFATEGKGTIRLDLPGAIDLKVWDTPTIRISFTVSSPGIDAATLGGLADAGRYNLVSKSEDDVLTIFAPNMQRQLKLKGQEVRETLSYVVFVPRDLKIEMPNAETYAKR